MDAALELVGAGPPARALFFVGADRSGARNAADRAVADVVQRVVRNLIHLNVGPNSLFVPLCQRMELPNTVALGPFELRRAGPARRLIAPDARDPGVVGLEDAEERLDLPDLAAAVGIALPEVRPLGPVLLRDRRDLRPDQREPVALDEAIARLVRLAEE